MKKIALNLTVTLLIFGLLSSCAKKASETLPAPVPGLNPKPFSLAEVHFFFTLEDDTFITADKRSAVELKKVKGQNTIYAYGKKESDYKVVALTFPNKIDTHVQKNFAITSDSEGMGLSYNNNTEVYTSLGKEGDSIFITLVDSSNKYIKGTFYNRVRNLSTKKESELKNGSFAFYWE